MANPTGKAVRHRGVYLHTKKNGEHEAVCYECHRIARNCAHMLHCLPLETNTWRCDKCGKGMGK